MAAHGGTVVTASGGASTQVDSANLNVTGTDLELIMLGSEEDAGSPTLTLTWDPTGSAETGTDYTGSPLSAGTYLDSVIEFIDDPTPANAAIRMGLSASVLSVVGGTFATAAGAITASDAATDSDAGTSTGLSATAPNAAANDLILGFLTKSGTGAPTWGANETARGNASEGSYLRVDIATQAGADGGAITPTYGSVGYGAVLFAVRIPDAGGGGSLSIPVAMHHYKQMGNN